MCAFLGKEQYSDDQVVKEHIKKGMKVVYDTGIQKLVSRLQKRLENSLRYLFDTLSILFRYLYSDFTQVLLSI